MIAGTYMIDGEWLQVYDKWYTNILINFVGKPKRQACKVIWVIYYQIYQT